MPPSHWKTGIAVPGHPLSFTTSTFFFQDTPNSVYRRWILSYCAESGVFGTKKTCKQTRQWVPRIGVQKQCSMIPEACDLRWIKHKWQEVSYGPLISDLSEKSFGFKQRQPEGRQSGAVLWWVSPQKEHACSPAPPSTKLKNKGVQLYCYDTKGATCLYAFSLNSLQYSYNCHYWFYICYIWN